MAKAEKKKKLTGRAKKRFVYNRRFAPRQVPSGGRSLDKLEERYLSKVLSKVKAGDIPSMP